MPRLAIATTVLLAFVAGFACSTVNGPAAPAGVVPLVPPGATLLDGLGDYRRRITTANPEAQRWFDQGLILAYGFNHDAAERSFLKATEADPECAMCWWGAALVLGPHVNAAMDPTNNAKAWMRAQKALRLAPRVDLWEQAFIEALAARYAEHPPQDRAPLDRAYADAMRRLAKRLPDDVDAATLYAEALMDLQPWNYYDTRGRPLGQTRQIVATLERVMALDPDHPGALHLYIHAVEASNKPDRGAAAADRLRELVPGSGHLVHMPAHIYTRVGRYHDAALANQKAIAADDAYLATCRPAPGVYPLGYVPHNHHFLWWASSMEGAGATALAAADETAKRVEATGLLKEPGFEFLQDFWVTPYKARTQFQRWDEIVTLPKPDAAMPYAVAMWHYAQGMAAVAQGRADDADAHATVLKQAAADPRIAAILVGPERSVSHTVKIAERVLAGRIAGARQDYPRAIAAFEQGVAAEDASPYFEPPLWHEPVRLHLGATLLAAGKAKAAETIYREDLTRNRDNGWAWRGLARSLRAQGKHRQAAEAESNHRRAWQYADPTLTAALP